jgi:3-oxoacyl-[acyl-carrier protein] reductase
VADASDEVKTREKELKTAGYDVMGFVIDLTNAEAVNNMVQNILDNYGQIDILCNVAGGGGVSGQPRPDVPRDLVNMPEEAWDRVVAINLKTAYYCCKAVLPNMIERKYGRIVNWSSVTGPMVVTPNSTAYSTAKGAVSGLTRALALEVAKHHITVNAICPGTVNTALRTKDRVAQLSKAIPLGRLGTPEEVADLALFLASDESKYITGTEIVFDGGDIIQERKVA